MTTYTIRTRGLIPVIYKQGPMSGIELDAPILLDLVMRGVDIVDDSTGKVVQISDIIVRPSKKEDEWAKVSKEATEPPKKPEPTPTPKKEVPQIPLQEAAKESPVPVPEKEPELPNPPAPVPAQEEPKKEDEPTESEDDGDDSAEEEPAETDASATTATPGVPDKYAGMSRNQRKKAMKRDAEAAARAAQNPPQGQSGAQTIN